jgi:hypothetical protein
MFGLEGSWGDSCLIVTRGAGKAWILEHSFPRMILPSLFHPKLKYC